MNEPNANTPETETPKTPDSGKQAKAEQRGSAKGVNAGTFAAKVAERYGWELCDDQDLLTDIIAGLETNYRRYGYFQCPCRDSWGQKDKDRDIICPCDYAAPDIAEYGNCYCGLFFEPKTEPNIPQPIPERRADERYP